MITLQTSPDPAPRRWQFLDEAAVRVALGPGIATDMLQSSSLPTDEEAAVHEVLGGLESLANDHLPPMVMHTTPQHPTMPWLIHEWWVAMVMAEEDRTVIAFVVPRRHQASVETTVERSLHGRPGQMVDGSLAIGRLGEDGRPIEPLRTIGMDLLQRWENGLDTGHQNRTALLDLARQIPDGGLRRAHETWLRTELLGVLPGGEATPTSDVTPRRRL